MRLVLISDTHGQPERLEIPAGDVFIHAGDLITHGPSWGKGGLNSEGEQVGCRDL